MANQNSDFMTMLPRLRNLVDPKVETEIYQSFLRIYDYFTSKLNQQKSDFDAKLKSQVAIIESQSSLLNGFGTKLIGLPDTKNPLVTLGSGTVTIFTVTDGAIFNVTTSDTTPNLALKAQNVNKGLFGPTSGGDAIPTFRKIVADDLIGIETNDDILDWLAQ